MDDSVRIKSLETALEHALIRLSIVPSQAVEAGKIPKGLLSYNAMEDILKGNREIFFHQVPKLIQDFENALSGVMFEFNVDEIQTLKLVCDSWSRLREVYVGGIPESDAEAVRNRMVEYCLAKMEEAQNKLAACADESGKLYWRAHAAAIRDFEERLRTVIPMRIPDLLPDETAVLPREENAD